MRKSKAVGIGLAVVMMILVVTFIKAQSVPQLINYQGKLTDDAGQPIDGETVDMTFTFSVVPKYILARPVAALILMA